MAKYGVFLNPLTLDRMVVVKTTVGSPADSDWDSQDGEVDFKTVAVKSLWAVEDGDDIHIVTQQENGRVAYHLFNPGGPDTWTTKNETVAEIGDTNFDVVPANFAVSIALRADGDVIVIAAYNDGSNETLRLFSEQGGGWVNEGEATAGTASTDYAGVSMVGPDGSDRVTWIYGDTTNDDVRLQSLTSLDAFETDKSVDADADTATIIVAPGVIDSADKIYFPYIDADNQISIASWTSGDDPTVAIDSTLTARTVFGHGRTAFPYAAACLALDGSTDVHLAYHDDVSRDIYHENDVDGAVGSDTLIETIPKIGPGTIWAWGQNNIGQLGQDDTTNRSSPIQVGALDTWTVFKPGHAHSVAIKDDNTLWAWGGAAFGRLGNGTTTPNISSPIQIGSLTDWAWAFGGGGHSVAIKTNDSLWSWGFNDDGQLGDGTTTSISSPTQVGSLTDWSTVICDFFHNLAIKKDGTLWTWGLGDDGRLGHGDVTSLSSPVQVGALTDWVQVDCGDSHSAAVKNDGTLWTWGNGLDGRLGHGNVTSLSSPVQVGALTDWANVTVGGATLAVKTDGSLWSWGINDEGQLGDGGSTSRSSPVQVGALTDWSSVSIVGPVIAIKTDGTLWAWGDGEFGKLGDGTTVSKSSPVQIGALTDWSGSKTGVHFSSARKGASLNDQRISMGVIA